MTIFDCKDCGASTDDIVCESCLKADREAMKKAAADLKIPLEWGGDWEMRDGPHYQLPWKNYPL